MFRNGIGWYCWAGDLSTLFDIDPKNELIIITLTQYCPETGDWIFPLERFRINNLVYDALEKNGNKIRE
jgi:CubicO group peptidase (beta-lactamase class C family)